MDTSDEFFVKVANRQDLLGILLGYGKENSCSFQRVHDIEAYYNQYLDPSFHLRGDLGRLTSSARELSDKRIFKEDRSIALSPHPDYGSLADELEDLERHSFDLTDSDSDLDFFSPPRFAVFKENKETMELKKDYTKTRQRLANLPRNKSLLEVIMMQWTGETQ